MSVVNTNVPSGFGSNTSSLRQLLNEVATRSGAIPAIATRGCTVRSATYATTASRATDVIQSIAATYPQATPYTDSSAGVNSPGTGSTLTINAKSGTTGLVPMPVYGVYIRVNASNQVTLGGMTFTVTWSNFAGESMNNTFTVDPAFSDPGGVKQVEAWVFPAVQVLGRFVYAPAALRPILETATPVTVQAAQNVVVADTAAGRVPQNATVFATLLVRGQREVDDTFTSWSNASGRLARIARSI